MSLALVSFVPAKNIFFKSFMKGAARAPVQINNENDRKKEIKRKNMYRQFRNDKKAFFLYSFNI